MKFKALLRKYVTNNIGYKVMAILFAFLLWLVILNSTDPEQTKTITNIPVQILNEDRILDGTHVYTIASGETTNIIVTGKKSIITELRASDFNVTADFNELSITNAVPIKAELTGTMARYSGSVNVSTRDTSMLINLEDMDSKQVNVELSYAGREPEDMVIEEANIAPKKITISAAESIVEAADKAVVTANYADIDDGVTLTLTPDVKDVNGRPVSQMGDVHLDETAIEVEFKVSRVKDVPIIINVTGTPAEGYVFDGLELSQDTISVKGPQQTLKFLRTLMLPKELININGASEDFDVEIDVSEYLPETLSVFGESPTFTATVKIVSAEEAAGQE